MKIVITGANGFVGASLCRYFHAKGHQIIATGRQRQPHQNLWAYADYFAEDITQPMAEFDADVCIHTAGLADDTAHYDALYLNNVTGTANVLAAAKNCKYLVYISSSSVYHFSNKKACEDDVDLQAKISDYGRTKLLAEGLFAREILAPQTGLILRPRAIYGVGARVLLPRLLKLINFNKIIYAGKPQLKTSATHIDHIGDAIALFLDQKDKPALQVFNIADDEVYALKQIAISILSAVGGRRLKTVTIPLWVIKGLARIRPKLISPVALSALTQNSVLDISRIKSKLGYRPVKNWENSYKAIGEWVKSTGGKKAYLNNLNMMPWTLTGKDINEKN